MKDKVNGTGWNTIQTLYDLERKIDKLGFKLRKSTEDWYYINALCLIPNDNCYPIYHRSTEVFSGSLEELAVWVKGLEWSRQYDSILTRGASDTMRNRAEQDYLNQELANLVRESEPQ